jgi:hypothetical protein
MTTTTPEPVTAPGEAADLAARVAEWITREGITGNYDTAGIAARIVAAFHPDKIGQWLAAGGSDYLRHACANLKDHADLTPAEAWAEDYRHGNLRDDLQRWGA